MLRSCVIFLAISVQISFSAIKCSVVQIEGIQDVEDVPYLLSLNQGNQHICGAVVVTEKWALTSARCVSSYTNILKSYMSLRAMSSSANSGGFIKKISKIKLHPFFNRDSSEFDFALIEVSTPFPPGCKSVDLPRSWSEPKAGNAALVLGWGGPYKYNQISSLLFSNDVNIINRRSCSALQKENRNERYAKFICSSKSYEYPCLGDNGGPLMDGNVLLGVALYRNNCSQTGYPTVYGNVGNYYVRSWITRESR